MPRVHTAVARQNYPAEGIHKGDTYYYWKNFRCPVQRSLKPPRQSQLTNSKMSGAYAAAEVLEDWLKDGSGEPDDAIAVLNQAKDDIQSVADEYRESFEAMEEVASGGSRAAECEEKADSLEEWISEIDDAISEIERLDAADYIDEDELIERARYELEDDGGLSPSREEIEAHAEKIRSEIKSYDDLDGRLNESTGAMQQAVMDLVAGVANCPY